MVKRERLSAGRVARLVVLGLAAAAALASTPALADHAAPGSAAFDGAYAADGYINAAESDAADPAGRPVAWTDPAPGVSAYAVGRFAEAADPAATPIGGDNTGCGPFTLPPDHSASPGYLNLGCMANIEAVEPAGGITVHWVVQWFDVADVPLGTGSDDVVVDTRIAGTAISSPAPGTIKPRRVAVTGTADPGSSIQLFNGAGATLLNAPLPVAAASGQWSASVEYLSSGPKSLRAQAADPAGNGGALTPEVVFDTDVSLPGGSITSPGMDQIYRPGETVTIEGTATDDYAGLAAVDVRIFNVAGLQVFQQGAACTPACSVTSPAPRSVGWSVGPNLPVGTYVVKAWPVDRAGNRSAQPLDVRYVDLSI